MDQLVTEKIFHKQFLSQQKLKVFQAKIFKEYLPEETFVLFSTIKIKSIIGAMENMQLLEMEKMKITMCLLEMNFLIIFSKNKGWK